jgi:hypothetical protein
VSRLTPEREAEIRQRLAIGKYYHHTDIHALLAELDWQRMAYSTACDVLDVERAEVRRLASALEILPKVMDLIRAEDR